MTRHQLDPSPSTTVDVFCRDLPPVLTVDPGDTVVLRSLDASGHLQPQTFPGEKVPTMASKRSSGHCLTGPIAVRGAVPGEVVGLAVVLRRELIGPADGGVAYVFAGALDKRPHIANAFGVGHRPVCAAGDVDRRGVGEDPAAPLIEVVIDAERPAG